MLAEGSKQEYTAIELLGHVCIWMLDWYYRWSYCHDEDWACGLSRALNMENRLPPVARFPNAFWCKAVEERLGLVCRHPGSYIFIFGELWEFILVVFFLQLIGISVRDRRVTLEHLVRRLVDDIAVLFQSIGPKVVFELVCRVIGVVKVPWSGKSGSS